MIRTTHAILAAASVCLLAGPGTATAEAPATADQPVVADGMRAVRDKKTGKLRAPNDKELKELLKAEKASGRPQPTHDTSSVIVRKHENGMLSAELGPEFLVSVEAYRDENGMLSVRHSDPRLEHSAPNQSFPTE